MRTALITGADRGLGLSLAIGLLKQGWQVFAGRFLTEYTLLEDAQAAYPLLHPVQLDVSSRDSILTAFHEVSKATDHLDLIISNAAYMGGPNSSTFKGELPIDFPLLEYSFRVNSLGALQVMEVFLPLLAKGETKRFCFVSSEVSSVTMMHRDGGFRYTMTKTALNIAARIMYNQLFDQGYTFRLYQPGWMKHVNPDGSRALGADLDPDFSAVEALHQFLENRDDEQRLVLTDYEGHEWAY